MIDNSSPVWVPTPQAARQLGRSRSTLLRMVHEGRFEPGVHYVKGPHTNSPTTWNCQAITELLAAQTRMPAPPRPTSDSTNPMELEELIAEVQSTPTN